MGIDNLLTFIREDRMCDDPPQCGYARGLQSQWSLPKFAQMHFIIEGIDRLGKDTLTSGIQDRCGYHLVLHYQKPQSLEFYRSQQSPTRAYQEASFKMMFSVLSQPEGHKIICNRSHLGEAVYARRYRDYDGNYIFNIETEAGVHEWSHLRMILLTEDFSKSRHFRDDGKSLGAAAARQSEQADFETAFAFSRIRDKRILCVTDPVSGQFRSSDDLLAEALAS